MINTFKKLFALTVKTASWGVPGTKQKTKKSLVVYFITFISGRSRKL